jgi:hypothetical protein
MKSNLLVALLLLSAPTFAETQQEYDARARASQADFDRRSYEQQQLQIQQQMLNEQRQQTQIMEQRRQQIQIEPCCSERRGGRGY